MRVLRRGKELVSITPEIMDFLNEPRVLIITKANVRSRIHRRVHMDYIGVKHFDVAGNLIGEYRIVGLFTSTAYTRSTRSIPYLRHKVDAVIARAGFDAGRPLRQGARPTCWTPIRATSCSRSTRTRSIRNALIDHAARGAPAHPRAGAARPFDRFVSVLVYVPRDRFDSTRPRRRSASILADDL